MNTFIYMDIWGCFIFLWRGSTKHDLNSLKHIVLKLETFLFPHSICLPKPVLSICIMLSNTLAANNTINTKGYLGVMAFFLSLKYKAYFKRDLNFFTEEKVFEPLRWEEKKKAYWNYDWVFLVWKKVI